MLRPKVLLTLLLAIVLAQSIYLVYLYPEYTRLQAEHELLREEYTRLSVKLRELENMHSELGREYENLKESYESLKSELRRLEWEKGELAYLYERAFEEYKQLKQKYTSLLNEYSTMVEEYRTLKENYTLVYTRYSHIENLALLLNTSLSNISSTLLQLCCIPEAFTRTLTIGRVHAVGKYVWSAGVRADDPWTSIQAIYNWVRSNVRYVQDVPVPAPRSKTCDSLTNLCIYEFAEAWNYVQDPELTAFLGQGDCDDQAILVYAMLKYYFLYVHGKDYRIWIALVQLGRGIWHMALFIPAIGGRLTIVDPAGSYLTTTWYGGITANSVREELARYSNHWRDYGGIRYIELYEVDVYSGIYNLVVSGDQESIASFIVLSTS